MKYVRPIQSLLCASLLFACGLAQAQQAPAAAQRRPAQQAALLVGVIDMRAVLQNHPIVADEIPGLGQQLQAMQADLVAKSRDAQKQIEGIQQQYKIGSPEFEERIAPLRQQMREAEAQAQEKQQMLVAERTQMMYRVYKDVQAAVDAVARQRGVIIVHSKIKYSRDANVSEEVVALEEANQNPIVWNREECDITEAVKAQLAATVGAPKTQATAAASNATPLSNVGAAAVAAGRPAAAQNAAAKPVRSAQTGVAAPRR